MEANAMYVLYIILPSISEQVVPRVLLARRPLLPRPGHEAADGLVRQQLFRGGEALGERRRVVRAVDGAMAGPADGDGVVQDRVSVSLLPVSLVGAPVFVKWNDKNE